MASLINGCLIVSTVGKYTTEALRNVLFATFPITTVELEAGRNSVDNVSWKKYVDDANTFIKAELPESWDDVVEKYNSL